MKKNKFNIVDTFVVLIMLALIFGIVAFFIRENETMNEEKNDKNIIYTICISGIEEEYVSTFVASDKIHNASTLNYLGKITGVEVLPSKENGSKAIAGVAEGEYILEQKERHGLCDVYITISSKTKLDSRGVAYIDSERITIGTLLNIRCDNFAAKAHITVFSIS